MRLNSSQTQAAAHAGGPALVLAGAGSGKTRVIIERMAWLIGEQGLDPRHLLALTFTNKAANEMRTRLAARLGADRVGVWVGTFHSFALFLLRREFDRMNRSRSFTVYDDADQLSLMKLTIAEAGKAAQAKSPREALVWISRRKQDLGVVTPELRQSDPVLCELWERYQAALEHNNAVDFDDLLVFAARLLVDHHEVRAKYQRRFQHVLVDEYQDTNHAQYTIARQLGEGHDNIFVVGDEDQSIYGWRGANIRNILEFERDFPRAQVYRLEQNYRSTAPILESANAVVAHNTQRLGKTLWTEQTGGQPVAFFLAQDGEEEARFVASEIAKSHTVDDSIRSVAVLFRTNGQARVIEEAMRQHNLAYVVVGGISFYARKEIKDIIAYLRVIVNSADNISLRRIINVPARGIGSVTLDQIATLAAERNQSVFATLRELEHDTSFSARARTSTGELVHLIDELALQAERDREVKPLAERLLEETKYRAHIEHAHAEDWKTRIEIVDEFLSACTQYDEDSPQGLLAFLQELALVADIDLLETTAEDQKAAGPTVSLMTCHSAKGLEFDRVFLVGLEEGLLPHASTFEDPAEIEEERRLCYVAMTRARKVLTLSGGRRRLLYGKWRDCELSRFVDEIPRNKLTRLDAGGKTESRPAPRAKPVQASAPVDGLKTGARIRHTTFGKGTVLFTKGTGAKARVRIRFDTGRSRDFLVCAAPLEILEGPKR